MDIKARHDQLVREMEDDPDICKTWRMAGAEARREAILYSIGLPRTDGAEARPECN